MVFPTIEERMQAWADDPELRREEFYRYYSDKRILHQLKQLEMLGGISGSRLTEIGSYLGFATALFSAAGFDVSTINPGPQEVLGGIQPTKHIPINILDVTEEHLAGQDIVVCCETLEHLHFVDTERVLKMFHASCVDWVLISVPYRCFSVDIRYVFNPFTSMLRWATKFPSKIFKEFPIDPIPQGHKWELGYKGYPSSKLTDTLKAVGFDVVASDFMSQSVFFLARRIAPDSKG